MQMINAKKRSMWVKKEILSIFLTFNKSVTYPRLKTVACEEVDGRNKIK